MLAALARTAGAALLASCSLVAVAAPASAEDCVTVDGRPLVCVGVTVVPTTDTFNGATASLLVEVDVCLSDPDSRACDGREATLALGPTGLLLNGVALGSAGTGDIPVHVPEVCFNTTCVGPFDRTIPSADLVCLWGGDPTLMVNGDPVSPTGTLRGTC